MHSIVGLFDNVLSEVLWARGVLLLGPTLATVGLNIQVPASLVVDLVTQKASWVSHAPSLGMVLGGAAGVLLGVGLLAINGPPPVAI